MELSEFNIDAGTTLRIRFVGKNGINSRHMTLIINAIESACLDQEIETLTKSLSSDKKKEFRQLTRRLRMKPFDRPPTFMLTSAREGSIIIEGLLIGGLAWLLVNSCGETVKEAWKETNSHRRLKRLLLSGRDPEADSTAESIDSELNTLYVKRVIKRSKTTVIVEGGRTVICSEVELITENEIGMKDRRRSHVINQMIDLLEDDDEL